MTTSNIKATIHHDINKVWNTVLDIEKYNEWRSDLSKIERIDEKQFIEFTKDGYPTTFTVTTIEPNKSWKFDMENSNMSGHWIGIFNSRDNETEIDFTEHVTVKKFFMKPFVKIFLKRQQALFIKDLEKVLSK